jgi:hypothetical protein
MEIIPKRKVLWKYTNIMIPNPTDDQEILIVDGKKDEDLGVITTYISWEI